MGKRSKPDTPSNVWVETVQDIIWIYRDYKCCMLSVCKMADGKYKPSVNGSSNIKIENWSYTDTEPLLFDTLEEAQNHAMRYMDAMRAREAEEFKKQDEYRKNILKAYVANRSAED